MKKIFFQIILTLLPGLAQAGPYPDFPLGYTIDNNKCRLIKKSIRSFNSKKVCMMELDCETYASLNKAVRRSNRPATAYCYLDKCQTTKACIEDNRIFPSQYSQIKEPKPVFNHSTRGTAAPAGAQ